MKTESQLSIYKRALEEIVMYPLPVIFRKDKKEYMEVEYALRQKEMAEEALIKAEEK